MNNRKQIDRVYMTYETHNEYAVDVSIVEKFIKETREKYPDKELNLAFDSNDEQYIVGLIIYVYDNLTEDELQSKKIHDLQEKLIREVNDHCRTVKQLEINKSQIPQYERKIEYLNKSIDDTIKALKELGIDYKTISTER